MSPAFSMGDREDGGPFFDGEDESRVYLLNRGFEPVAVEWRIAEARARAGNPDRDYARVKAAQAYVGAARVCAMSPTLRAQERLGRFRMEYRAMLPRGVQVRFDRYTEGDWTPGGVDRLVKRLEREAGALEGSTCRPERVAVAPRQLVGVL